MQTERYFARPMVPLASVVLATLLIACQQSQPPAATQSTAASTEKVFVVFEGP